MTLTVTPKATARIPLLEVHDDVLDIVLLARWRPVRVATVYVLEHATETMH